MAKEALCPRFEKALSTLSKRWNAFIIYQLLSGPQRFSEIESALPNLSGKVLSERLKQLEAEGVVRRAVYPEMPVRIEYSLTDKGEALAPIFTLITDWSAAWIPTDDQNAQAEPPMSEPVPSASASIDR